MCCPILAQVSERQETIQKLRNENREMEEKLRESLSNVQHRGEVCKQLKDDLKQTTAKVRT